VCLKFWNPAAPFGARPTIFGCHPTVFGCSIGPVSSPKLRIFIFTAHLFSHFISSSYYIYKQERTTMKLIHTSPPAVFTSLKARGNPRSRYCPTISGCISVGDFVCMDAALNVVVLIIDAYINFVSTQMLKHFRASVTFVQVTNIYESQQDARLSDDEDVIFDMNLYLKRYQLPSSLGRFNSRVPRESMLVQTKLVIEGCELREINVPVVVIHMDKHDKLMEGLINVYFLEILYEPANLWLLTKSRKFHIHSSSDLYHTYIP
jgi:hypothetical protein